MWSRRMVWGLGLVGLMAVAQPDVLVPQAHAGKGSVVCPLLQATFLDAYMVLDWATVDDTYSDLESWGCPMISPNHHWGAVARVYYGDIAMGIVRYELAGQYDLADDLRDAYGEVDLDYRFEARHTLTRTGGATLWPGTPQANAVLLAQDAMDGPHKSHGYLPPGNYTVGNVGFVVVGGGAEIVLP